MPICTGSIITDDGVRYCYRTLTEENVKRDNYLCDVCSGREAVNARFRAHQRPVTTVDEYEQLGLFGD